MKEKKAKKTLQVRDLTPTKDVSGGNRRHRGVFYAALRLNEIEDPRNPRGGYGIHMPQ